MNASLQHLASLLAMCSVAACTTDDGNDGNAEGTTTDAATTGADTGTDAVTTTSGSDSSAGDSSGDETGTAGTGGMELDTCAMYAAHVAACESPLAETAEAQCRMYTEGEDYSSACQQAFVDIYACLTALDCEQLNDVFGDYCSEERARTDETCAQS